MKNDSRLFVLLSERFAKNDIDQMSFVAPAKNLKEFQKQTFRGVHRERCSENTQQINRRTAMPKLIGISIRHGCSSVNLLHIFRTSIPKNTYGGLLLEFENSNGFSVFKGLLSNQVFQYVTWNKLAEDLWLPKAVIYKKISNKFDYEKLDRLKNGHVMQLWKCMWWQKILHDVTV